MRSTRIKEVYKETEESERRPSGVLKVSLVAISSALLGGLAAAWWHRKTLAKLQNPILSVDIPKTGYENQAFEDDEDDPEVPFS